MKKKPVGGQMSPHEYFTKRLDSLEKKVDKLIKALNPKKKKKKVTLPVEPRVKKKTTKKRRVKIEAPIEAPVRSAEPSGYHGAGCRRASHC